MTIRGIAAIIALSVTGACSKASVPANNDLITVSEYPQTINAQSVTGELARLDRCVTFTSSDGRTLIPVFRADATLTSLRNNVGDLKQPQRVTVAGMTIIDPVPDEISKAMNDRDCQGIPFYFGGFEVGNDNPQPPRA